MSYFMIISRLNGLAVDLDGGKPDAGTRVTTWPRSGADSQLWYDHRDTGTIRNKLNDLCIDLKGDGLIVNPFEPGDPDQQWERVENYIVNRISMNEVLDISHSNMEKGAAILKYYNTGATNQLWSFEFMADEESKADKSNDAKRQYFFIISELNELALDLKDGSADPRTRVVTWPKSDADSQLWFEDSDTGTIRNKLNDLCLDIEGSTLVVNEYEPEDEDQQWERRGNLIANRNNSDEVVDIRYSMKEKGAEIVVYRNTGGKNQHWKFQPYEPSRKEDPEEDQAAVERPTEEEQVEQQKSYAEQLSGRKSPTTEKHPLLQKEDEEEEKRRLFVTPVRVAVVVICLVGVLVLLLSFSVVFYYEDVSLSDKDRSKGKNITAESNVSLSRPQMLTGLNGYLSGSVGPGVVDETPSQPEVPQRQAAAAPDKQPAKLVPRRPETDRPAFRKPTNASSDRSEETEATRQADGPSELQERLAWLNASEAEVTAPPEATTEGYLQPEVTTSWPEFLPDIDLKQPEKPSRR